MTVGIGSSAGISGIIQVRGFWAGIGQDKIRPVINQYIVSPVVSSALA